MPKGDGFTTIMDTVETALGAPPVDELVKEKGPNSPPDAENIEREDQDGMNNFFYLCNKAKLRIMITCTY